MERRNAFDGTINGNVILHGVLVANDKALQDDAVVSGGDSSKCKPPATNGSGGIESIERRAVEVIESQEGAMRWLGLPVRALNYATPVSLLGEPEGEARVAALLTKIEHGVL